MCWALGELKPTTIRSEAEERCSEDFHNFVADGSFHSENVCCSDRRSENLWWYIFHCIWYVQCLSQNLEKLWHFVCLPQDLKIYDVYDAFVKKKKI